MVHGAVLSLGSGGSGLRLLRQQRAVVIQTSATANKTPTWSPKVCRIMALLAVSRGFEL